MVSSSSSSSSSNVDQIRKHDVFLSFSGEDTRIGFTGHLFGELKRKGISVYMDEQGLKKGDELSPALLKAIEESKMSLVIFSKSYTCSSWCLRELSKIMELKRAGKQIVVPIFYHVKPSDLRKHPRRLRDFLAIHPQGHENDLFEACNFKGWHIKEDTSDRSELEYINAIFEHIKHEFYPPGRARLRLWISRFRV